MWICVKKHFSGNATYDPSDSVPLLRPRALAVHGSIQPLTHHGLYMREDIQPSSERSDAYFFNSRSLGVHFKPIPARIASKRGSWRTRAKSGQWFAVASMGSRVSNAWRAYSMAFSGSPAADAVIAKCEGCT
jgi:hypothetical protein